MAIPEYKVVLGRKKYRNEQEVEALLRAVGGGDGPPVKSLVLELNSLRGIASQQKLFQSLSLHGLEELSLSLEYSTGAESLRVLASAIEAGKLPSLRRLRICYREDYETQLRAQRPAKAPSNFTLKTSEDQFSSNSFSLLSALVLSSSSSSSVLIPSDSGSGTWASQSQGNPTQAASWEGFALLAQVLKRGSLQKLEEPVVLDGNWKSRSLGDTGSKFLAEIIGTGFFTGLKHLQLEDNSIGNEGLAAIADALREGKLMLLETLNLSHNFFTPVEGLLRILNGVEANHLPALKKLQLVGAGCRTVSSDVSVADEIVGIFARNSGLTAEVETDWPTKSLQSRWKKVRKCNAKLARKMTKLSQVEVPAVKAILWICGFPTVRT